MLVLFFWQFTKKQHSCLAETADDGSGDSALWWTLCNISTAEGVTDGQFSLLPMARWAVGLVAACHFLSYQHAICSPSFPSCTSHRRSWSSLAQSTKSESCAQWDAVSSLWVPPQPRRLLEDVAAGAAASSFLGFLTSPTSRNSRERLTRRWPKHDSEPLRRFRGTSNMVSSRLQAPVVSTLARHRQSGEKRGWTESNANRKIKVRLLSFIAVRQLKKNVM